MKMSVLPIHSMALQNAVHGLPVQAKVLSTMAAITQLMTPLTCSTVSPLHEAVRQAY
jgi:hypothetical protein